MFLRECVFAEDCYRERNQGEYVYLRNGILCSIIKTIQIKPERAVFNKNMRITQYLKETRAEMANIKWPTRKETILHTALVIVISVLVGLFLSGLDLGFGRAMRELISTFSI